ncbi:MAG: hypothetical protein E7J94_14650 [Clostridium sp.]|nr:hypothetical protein [Clostridium sp.]
MFPAVLDLTVMTLSLAFPVTVCVVVMSFIFTILNDDDNDAIYHIAPSDVMTSAASPVGTPK